MDGNGDGDKTGPNDQPRQRRRQALALRNENLLHWYDEVDVRFRKHRLRLEGGILGRRSCCGKVVESA